MAVSLVHGGPAPRFLSPQLYQALVCDPDKVTVPITLLPDSTMKTDLEKVRHSPVDPWTRYPVTNLPALPPSPPDPNNPQ